MEQQPALSQTAVLNGGSSRVLSGHVFLESKES